MSFSFLLCSYLTTPTQHPSLPHPTYCSKPGLPFYCLSSFLSIKPRSMSLGLFGREKLKLLVLSAHQPEKAKTRDSPKNNRSQIILRVILSTSHGPPTLSKGATTADGPWPTDTEQRCNHSNWSMAHRHWAKGQPQQLGLFIPTSVY